MAPRRLVSVGAKSAAEARLKRSTAEVEAALARIDYISTKLDSVNECLEESCDDIPMHVEDEDSLVIHVETTQRRARTAGKP
jgi:hypothetical protein